MLNFESNSFYKLPSFHALIQIKARFGNFLMVVVCSVSQDNVLGNILCLLPVINVTSHIKTANPIRLCSSIYLDRKLLKITVFAL